MELFSRAMAALAEYQGRTGRPYHTIIDLDSTTLSSLRSRWRPSTRPGSGKPVSAVWVRQTLRRARECLADLLLGEVSDSLGNTTIEELEQELIILDMLGYCQESLRRRARQEGASGRA